MLSLAKTIISKGNIWLTNLWKRINALSGPVWQYLTDRGKSPMTSFDQHCLPLCTSFRLSLGWSTFFPLLDVIRFYSHLKTIFFLWLTVSTYMQSFGLLQKQLFGLHYICNYRVLLFRALCPLQWNPLANRVLLFGLLCPLLYTVHAVL